MPRITTAELEEHERQKSRPGATTALQKAPGELVVVFVPGKLRNPLNGLKHWRAEKRYRVEWKERVALALLGAGWTRIRHSRLLMPAERGTGWRSVTPKVVTMAASLWGRMDSDGLQAALKPVRDALVECGVISGDADRDGHSFEYSQVIDRTNRGVEIRVSLRPTGSPPSGPDAAPPGDGVRPRSGTRGTPTGGGGE